MKNESNIKFNVLDGSADYQKKSTEVFLNELSKDDIKSSMSDEFAYLDEIGRASCRKECRSRWSPYH